MKRIMKLLGVFLLVNALTFAGDYVPGIYRASKTATHSKGFKYTNFVTMIVNQRGNIENVIIDATFPVDSKDLKKGYTTKQLLGDDYGMRKASKIGKEWNEQADAIGKHVVENQGLAFKLNKDKKTDDIAGATVKMHYYQGILAKVLAEAKKK